jgi:hypothetical protein
VTAAELNQFRSRVSYAAGITREWGRKFKDDYIRHFDFEKKEIYYKKSPEIETGIKMGPLRYVQYKLCSIICNLLRNDKIWYEEFQNLEWFMQNKIDFIRPYVKGLGEDRDVADLSLIYYTCLQIHHVCQKRYKQVTWSDPFVFHLDSDENKTLQEMLISLNKIMEQISLK